MKALFLTNEYPPNVYGGAGVHVDYLSRALARHIDVEVRCFGAQHSQQGESIKVAGHGYDDWLHAVAMSKLKSPLQALSRCLRFNADPIDADVVHCHTWYSHFGGIVAKQAQGVPMVITAHSLEPLRPWKREQLDGGYDLTCWIEQAAMEMADAIVAVSKGMRDDVVRLFDVPEERVVVIHNGIDTAEYRPVDSVSSLVKHGVDPDVPYVLFVGRITRQKGIIHLVNAIEHIHPSVQVVLCAGAPDTRDIAEEMEAGVRRVQAERDGVIWINGMVDRTSAIELYSHAAVFCCPSIYEPFGIINLEAMACGTPVVAAAVGGITEVVVHEETGFLVPLDQETESPFEPIDPRAFSRALAEQINRLIADPKLREQMGEAGRRRVVDRFGWDSIADQVRELYTRLTKNSEPATGRS